jgi:hypothetical protein
MPLLRRNNREIPINMQIPTAQEALNMVNKKIQGRKCGKCGR